jgi:hypothetical protein
MSFATGAGFLIDDGFSVDGLQPDEKKTLIVALKLYRDIVGLIPLNVVMSNMATRFEGLDLDAEYKRVEYWIKLLEGET